MKRRLRSLISMVSFGAGMAAFAVTAQAAGHAGGPVMSFPPAPGQAAGDTGSAAAPSALPSPDALSPLGTMPPVAMPGQPGAVADPGQVLPQSELPPSAATVTQPAGPPPAAGAGEHTNTAGGPVLNGSQAGQAEAAKATP